MTCEATLADWMRASLRSTMRSELPLIVAPECLIVCCAGELAEGHAVVTLDQSMRRAVPSCFY
jgi:hypothetical protein